MRNGVIDAKLTTQEFIDEMKQHTPTGRFRREYLAELVEDELSCFNAKLIMQCIDRNLAPLTDDWAKQLKRPQGRYFMGDLGRKVDHSAIAVTRRDTNGEFAELVGML